MEEKERYITLSDRQIKDTYNNSQVFMSIKNVCKLLNQQDKRIKELEEALKNEEQLHDLCIEDNQKDKDFLRKQIKFESDARNRFMKENQKLKQQLQDLPKKIVCEISEAIERLSWRKRIYTNWEFDKEQLYKDLDTILKKYGGENESKGDVGE